MDHSKRRLLELCGGVAVGGLTGCLDSEPSRTPTGTRPLTTTDREDTVSAACRTRTPRPVPGVILHNDAGEGVTATITVQRKSDDASASVYEDTFTVDSGEHVEVYDVFPDHDEYEITVELDDETTTSADVEAQPTRHGQVAIRIEANNTIDIGWLHVVPPETPTPCP